MYVLCLTLIFMCTCNALLPVDCETFLMKYENKHYIENLLALVIAFVLSQVKSDKYSYSYVIRDFECI